MDNAALDDEKESRKEEKRKEEKLTSIMEAANALTALGDEDDVAVPLALASVSTTCKDIVDDEYRNDHDNDDDGKDQETVDNPAERKSSANHVVASTEVEDEPHESSTTTTTTAAALSATATPTTSTAATTTTTTVTKQEDYDGGWDNKVINNTTGSDEAIGTSTPAPNGITTTGTTVGSNSKRFLPEHKKPDAAPTFPEKVGQHGIDSCLICHSRVVIFSSDDSHLNLFRFFCFVLNQT
jgi:hypothetical protein